MGKRLLGMVILSMLTVGIFCGCSSLERVKKDINSDVSGGLNRTVTVYSLDGKKLKEIKGKIDLQETENGRVKFDLDKKRYIYYNALVEVIED